LLKHKNDLKVIECPAYLSEQQDISFMSLLIGIITITLIVVIVVNVGQLPFLKFVLHRVGQ